MTVQKNKSDSWMASPSTTSALRASSKLGIGALLLANAPGCTADMYSPRVQIVDIVTHASSPLAYPFVSFSTPSGYMIEVDDYASTGLPRPEFIISFDESRCLICRSTSEGTTCYSRAVADQLLDVDQIVLPVIDAHEVMDPSATRKLHRQLDAPPDLDEFAEDIRSAKAMIESIWECQDHEKHEPYDLEVIECIRGQDVDTTLIVVVTTS